MDEYGLSIKLVYPIMKTLVQQGYRFEQFCAYAGFDPGVLSDVENRIEAVAYDELLLKAAAFTGDEVFGLHQGESLEISDLGIVGYVMTHSPVLREALLAYERYNVIICSGIGIEMREEGDDVIIHFPVRDGFCEPSRHSIEGIASSVYRMFMKLSCRHIAVKDVKSVYAAVADIQPYKTFWGVAPSFHEAYNGFRISKEVLDYPIMYADSHLLQSFERHADETKTRVVQGRTFTDQLSQWMIQCVPRFLPSLQDASQEFNMSVRTVQSRLQKENTSFNEVRTRVLMELAMTYLKNPMYTVAEIAYLLHYSEPSAFQSAFKRWTGVPAGKYRLSKQGM